MARCDLVRLAILFLVACHQAAPPAPVISARVVATPARQRVASQPCPFESTGDVEHELVAACSPAPFDQRFSVCPWGECPKPCAAEVLDAMCDVAPCVALPLEREPDLAVVHRDRAGRVATTVAGQVTETYRWSGGRVVAWDGDWKDGHEHTTIERDTADRITATAERIDDGESRKEFAYNAAGDLGEIVDGSAVTTFAYDARRLPVGITIVVTLTGVQVVRHRKLGWDAEDRLVSDATLATDGTVERATTYRYDCP